VACIFHPAFTSDSQVPVRSSFALYKAREMPGGITIILCMNCMQIGPLLDPKQMIPNRGSGKFFSFPLAIAHKAGIDRRTSEAQKKKLKKRLTR
jgi:hypothetical protein